MQRVYERSQFFSKRVFSEKKFRYNVFCCNPLSGAHYVCCYEYETQIMI